MFETNIGLDKRACPHHRDEWLSSSRAGQPFVQWGAGLCCSPLCAIALRNEEGRKERGVCMCVSECASIHTYIRMMYNAHCLLGRCFLRSSHSCSAHRSLSRLLTLFCVCLFYLLLILLPQERRGNQGSEESPKAKSRTGRSSTASKHESRHSGRQSSPFRIDDEWVKSN